MSSYIFTALSPSAFLARSAFLATTLIAGISTSVGAQSSVSVDLSVLADDGYTDAQTGTSTGGNLLMPGAVMPKSSYFGPAVTITNPIPAPGPAVTATPEPVLSTADAVPPPAPEPAPAAPEAVVAETAPPAEPKVTEAPALPPEPEAVAASSDTATEDANAADMETASATTSGPTTLEPGRAMLVVFEGTETNLSVNAKGGLDDIAARVGANEDLRIQLMAYAGGNDLSSSRARRMSLSRALAVRSYFIEQGVRSTRIDVRAMGNNDPTEEDPINRVDVNITMR